jgi:hypothetical protein
MKGLLVGSFQLSLVLGMFLLARHEAPSLPRAWAKIAWNGPAPRPPQRYVSFFLEVDCPADGGVRLRVEGSSLFCAADSSAPHGRTFRLGPGRIPVLRPALILYLPRAVEVGDNTELWAEVSLPDRGRPRPIRLARKDDRRFTPWP